MFRRLLALLALCAIAPSTAWAEGKVSLDIAGNTVELEVATTTIEQRTGLMNRAMLAEDSGMLFVFAEPRSVAMWMKNTLIDLDAAFVDACGFILNIETMQKGTLDLRALLLFGACFVFLKQTTIRPSVCVSLTTSRRSRRSCRSSSRPQACRSSRRARPHSGAAQNPSSPACQRRP